LPGTEVIRQIRATSGVPVIMVSAKDDEVDKIVGLELGADDYVTKPFSPRELAARVRALLRRSSAQADARSSLAFGDVVLDGDARRVRKAGDEVVLTAREFDLLWFLAAHPQRVFSREQLMASVWGYEPALDSGTVTVHIRRLRTKVEDDPTRPRHLQTVWGIGYRLAP
jgi:DNA-binding response OmpR family regulator